MLDVWRPNRRLISAIRHRTSDIEHRTSNIETSDIARSAAVILCPVGERTRHRALRMLLAMLFAALAAALGACGGGGEKQDANEASGTFDLDVISASFPGRQRLAQESQLRISVKNVGDREIPNLAMTVDGFNQHVDDPSLANPRRNIWILNSPPLNSASAFPDTWTLGPVPAGATRTAVWNVTAVRPGTYTLRYRVGAGTDGRAQAELPDGSQPIGSFIARITDAPRRVVVD
jgi:hypothetical protein